MALVSADAVVLQVFAYGETSKILRLLTRTHGVQSVIAKGALRPRSRYGGVLEPFTEGVASFYHRDTRDLHTLSGFELTRSQQALGRDLVRFGGASLLAELILRTASEEPQPGLFDALVSALHAIRDASPEALEATLLARTWGLIGLLGFEPVLDQCVSCDRPIAGDEDVAFDYAAGGVRCVSCARGLAAHRLPPHARAALHAFTRAEAAMVPRTAGHWRLLGRYLDHHVLEGGSLRSLSFLVETLAPQDD